MSHDLIEGCHARAGLVSDIELIDDFPARYHAYARRQHRWVRGDWQLLPWLSAHVPSPSGRSRNPLTAISRWKIFDNLRRSLLPPALMVLLVCGWLSLPGGALAWSLAVLCVVGWPLFARVVAMLMGRPKGVSWSRYARAMSGQLALAGAQTLLVIAFLPHQAYSTLDAIVRTLLRLALTRRKFLQWETAHATEQRLGLGLRFFIVEMWSAPAMAVVLAGVMIAAPAPAIWTAAPFLALWFVSPWLAYYVSRPAQNAPPPLIDTERTELRRIARRTWLFFETFVGPDDHWLPPDNFQEQPKGVVAHRTSPTNEGMFLVSCLVAHDFGYLGIGELATWLERNVDHWTKLERYRGHALNWYDTQALAPLPPSYVSTVDSGNLAVCALTLRQGLLEASREPLFGPRAFAGLADVLAVAAEEFEPALGTSSALRRELVRAIERVAAIEHAAPRTARGWHQGWADVQDLVAKVVALLDVPPRAPALPPEGRAA
ncbi:MAG TPA: hypothetical protein VGX78_12400, partial [Pirellulales bacterium]|nr:hypothetical protein [Pirellulales bacterium]